MYNIGQFRRSQLDSYLESLNITDIQYKNASGNEIFRDAYVELQDTTFNNQNCYYLRFGVEQIENSTQVFSLKLQNTSEQQNNEQLIEQFKIEKGNKNIVYFEIIISPNETYNQILWELQRTTQDYSIQNKDGSYGRKMTIIVDECAQLIDVLAWLKTQPQYNGLKQFTKIGIQGSPSLLMCINREQIRIGRSGIYELNNGINITSISFVPKNTVSNNLDYFIMDFEY